MSFKPSENDEIAYKKNIKRRELILNIGALIIIIINIPFIILNWKIFICVSAIFAILHWRLK